MTDCGPIDCCNPTLPIFIIVNNTFRAQFIRLTVIVRVISVEGEDQSLLQLDTLTPQVLARAGTSQPQPVAVIEILEIGINPGKGHTFPPITACVGAGS